MYTVGGLAGMSRYMRACMLGVLRQDYILTARAKGLGATAVILRHALRSALLPVITLLGLSVPGLIGGSVIIESIFALPGLGQLFYGAVMARDYTLIMGNLVLGAVLTLAGNLLADFATGWPTRASATQRTTPDAAPCCQKAAWPQPHAGAGPCDCAWHVAGCPAGALACAL